MTQQPFTPDGVHAKIQELYALADGTLLKQADLISADFKSWIIGNFLLNPEEITFMNKMDTRFAGYCGTVTAAGVGHRLPVSINYPDPPSSYSSKYIIIIPKHIPKYDTMAGYTITGTLEFTFGFVI
jgi:hypothetical protein